jgi:hypothetical protein
LRSYGGSGPFSSFWSGFPEDARRRNPIGLGGARTHNQRLKRAILSICKILVVLFSVAAFVAIYVDVLAKRDIVTDEAFTSICWLGFAAMLDPSV